MAALRPTVAMMSLSRIAEGSHWIPRDLNNDLAGRMTTRLHGNLGELRTCDERARPGGNPLPSRQ